jgi:hypothetical protein
MYGTRQGTSQLTGWAFVTEPSGRFDGCVLYVLGAGSVLNLTGLIGQQAGEDTQEADQGQGEEGGWMLSIKYQAGGADALLQNMSTVLHTVSAIPSDHQVTVPPYSVVTIDRTTVAALRARGSNQ